ncbi:MAG TPA: RNA-binding S4 domain-containing protein [Paludibacteraceae bacterium]|nr:RNA-binding S4 domain-containing protein [Paludibacteraceae bacterium]
MEKITFELRDKDSFIQLIQLLKATDIVYSGSEAQQLVAEGFVLRNGVTEFRKRAKLVVGDVITYQEFEITIV